MTPTSFETKRCSVARALSHVGPWWSLLIVRDAMMGVRRFKEFERSLGIPKNTLANRLSELVENGVLARVKSSTGKKYLDYELTEKGLDLAPIVMALAQWGDKWSAHKDGPSFEILDGQSGEEISRIWPRDNGGNAIELSEIMLKRCSEGPSSQPRSISSQSGG